MPISLEVCIDSVESAVAAQRGGADRLELCRLLHVGGLTPSEALMRAVRSSVAIHVFVMIRPRDGHFTYDRVELQAMMHDIDLAKKCGVDGVVLGVLLPDGEVDVDATAELVSRARPLQVTFHRAFDQCTDLERSLERVISTGADRVLTSGGAAEAVQAAEKIARLVDVARGRASIMAGGGVRRQNVRDLILTSRVQEVHSTLGFSEWSKNVDWSGDGEDGSSSPASSRYVVEESNVHDMRDILDAISESQSVDIPGRR